MKILIVDSNPLFVEGLKNLLRAEGLEDIDTAYSNEAALNKTRLSVPDVVLMDTRMKPLSGFDTARQMRQEFPLLKIVMLSESGLDSEFDEAVMCGASDFLRKDIDADTLLEMFKNLREDTDSLPHG